MRTLLALILFVSNLSAQSWYGDEYQKVEHQCALCGQSIYENEKVVRSGLFYDRMGVSFGAYGVERIADSLAVFGINFNVGTGKICKRCFFLYRDKIGDLMRATWDTWLNSTMEENAILRKSYDAERRREATKELDRQIKELQEKRRALK